MQSNSESLTMCDHDPQKPHAAHFSKPTIAINQLPSTGSRRRRLWDLPQQCHCPVVGVCFPLDTLRRLVNKALGGKAMADDYEVHVGAVAECANRNRLSELMQDELDTRYAVQLKAYRAAKTPQAVAELWSAAVQQGDVTGAFWAALTHPRCDTILQEVLCRDMHMLQHQAGATVRVDIAKTQALTQENAVLAKELGKVQERSTRLLLEKSAELERSNAQLVQMRAESLAKDSRLSFLQQDMETLKASVADFDAGMRQQKKLEQMAARQAELETQNAELRSKLATAARSLDSLREESLRHAAMAEAQELRSIPIKIHLNQKTVLCVGGRSGNIPNYRDLVERVGGRFAHHDGGLEDNQSVLDASLAAADLVICQTGCISHNAYWRVKDFCKRTGKRCVFVENPSTSSMARGLEQISSQEPMALQMESNNVIPLGPKA